MIDKKITKYYNTIINKCLFLEEIMKKVAIVADNSGFLTLEDVEKYQVAKILPISFIVNGEEYYENQNMTYEEFYNFLQDKKTEVSTSQPSVENVKECWREVLNNYDEIVYILLSSGLSGACNSAINASHEEEFEGKVFVVNNQRVSFSNKFAVIEARHLINQGKSAAEIKEYLEKSKADSGIYIAVDTLKYLKKGGRVTPAAAAIGTLLNIKPILQIHGGKLDAFAKTMSMKQAKAKMITALKKEIEDRFPEEMQQGKINISIAHAYADRNSQELKDFEDEMKANFPGLKFFVNDPLPLFIVCHTGPGAVGVGYTVDNLGVLDK